MTNQNNMQFKDFPLAKFLQDALIDLNFHTPSPIQAQSITPLLEGKDLIGQAQTGTGKTAAFALPILQNIDVSNKTPQALVLAPTRELAIQVAEHFQALSKYQSKISVTILCGGQDYRPQLKQLRDGSQIIVGTPGRILDHLERGSLQLSKLKTIVLDEADEMLRMGFIEDVETILSKLPDTRQMLLFSATMPSRIKQIANRYLNNPQYVEIKAETLTVKTIEQRFIFTSVAEKQDALYRLLSVESHQGVIVFVRTKAGTEEVAKFLQQQDFKAMAIHGDLSQPIRERMIAQLKSGGIDILVATDVAARGLDVEKLTHVINYDIPQDPETYVHRIGRTGRAGRSGCSTLFVTHKESRMLNIIERHTRQRIQKISMPTDEAIQAYRKQKFLENVIKRKDSVLANDYRKLMQEFMDKEDMDFLDLISVLALMCNQDKPLKAKIPVFAEASFKKDKDKKKGRDERYSDNRFSVKSKNNKSFGNNKFSTSNIKKQGALLFRLDVGRMHGVKPGNIVGAIANESGLESSDITGLKIHEDHSTVCLPKNIGKDVIVILQKARVCGRQLKLQAM